MKSLAEARAEIDRIDAEIQRLISGRARVAQEVELAFSRLQQVVDLETTRRGERGRDGEDRERAGVLLHGFFGASAFAGAAPCGARRTI